MNNYFNRSCVAGTEFYVIFISSKAPFNNEATILFILQVG